MIARVALALALGVASAHAEGLSVRTGLWDVTTSGLQLPAAPQIPADKLAKLPPKLRAMLGQMTIAGGQFVPHRICVTAAMLQRAYAGGEHAHNCTRTTVADGPRAMEVHVSCTGKVAGSGSVRVEAPTPEHATGTVDGSATLANGTPMSIHGTIDGHWLGADCGGVPSLP